MILNTTTAISSENGRRWRPAPAIHVSAFLHAAAAVWLAAHPPAWPWALGVLGANHLALFLAAPRTRAGAPGSDPTPVRAATAPRERGRDDSPPAHPAPMAMPAGVRRARRQPQRAETPRRES